MLQQFNFQDHTVRVVLDDDNQPMFVAKDIATILGYADVYELDLNLVFGESLTFPPVPVYSSKTHFSIQLPNLLCRSSISLERTVFFIFLIVASK